MSNQTFRETAVSNGGSQIIRVRLAADHVLDAALPPKCGSCPKLVNGKCRSADGVQPKRSHNDVGCSGHPSWPLFEIVTGAINQARQGQVNSAARVLSEQTTAASPGQVAWLDTCESGEEFSPVRIVGQDAGNTAQLTANDRSVAWQGIGSLTPASLAASLMRSNWQ